MHAVVNTTMHIMDYFEDKIDTNMWNKLDDFVPMQLRLAVGTRLGFMLPCRGEDGEAKNSPPMDRSIYSGMGTTLLSSLRCKQTIISDLSKCDCVKCINGDSEDSDR